MQHAIKKLYYSITEAARIIGEEQHVLRYWEREFPQLRPQKNRAGNRVYTRRDLAILRVIKGLLREERYTVAGAREYLRQQGLPDEVDRMVEVPAEITGETVEAADVVVASGTTASGQAIVTELRGIAAELRARVAAS